MSVSSLPLARMPSSAPPLTIRSLSAALVLRRSTPGPLEFASVPALPAVPSPLTVTPPALPVSRSTRPLTAPLLPSWRKATPAAAMSGPSIRSAAPPLPDLATLPPPLTATVPLPSADLALKASPLVVCSAIEPPAKLTDPPPAKPRSTAALVPVESVGPGAVKATAPPLTPLTAMPPPMSALSVIAPSNLTAPPVRLATMTLAPLPSAIVPP